MNTIYLAGYAGHTPEQLKVATEQQGALVLDIRLVPFSQQPGWKKAELQATLGRSYTSVPALGNLAKRDGGAMRLADQSVGLDVVRMVAAQQPVVLLCGCGNPQACHRAMVGDLLRAEGYRVQELVWPEKVADAGKLRILSLWQPWATLMVIGAKKIETRSWSTSHRGPTVLHAAKSTEGLQEVMQRQGADGPIVMREPFRSVLKERGYRTFGDLPRGCALGVFDIVDCQPTWDIMEGLSEQERAFGGYEDEERFGWLTDNMRAFPQPVPWRGVQGLRTTDFDVEAALRGEEVLV